MNEQPQKKSYKLAWIAGASLVVLFVIVGVAFAIISRSNDTGKTATSTTTATASSTVATKEGVKKKLDNLNTSIKQAATDQASAKAALGDNKNQIKVGN